MSRPVLYQEFVLAFSEDPARAREERANCDPAQFSELVRVLHAQGHEVLINGEFDCVPTRVLVRGNPMKSSLKDDFYALASKARFPYRSGHFFSAFCQ